MASLAELEALLIRANAAAEAGDSSAATDAREIADLITQMRGQAQPAVAQIPGAAPGQVAPAAVEPRGTMAQMARDIPAGFVRGAASLPATATMLGGKSLEESQQLKKDIDEGLKSLLGADPESATYKGAKLLAEILGTAGLGPALGTTLKALTAGTRVAPAVAPVAEAITTGGMGATGAGGATGTTGLVTRAAGGAVGGGAGALATEGELAPAGVGAVFGGALPIVGQGLAPIVSDLWTGVLRPLTPSGRVQTAEDVLRAYAGDATAASRAIRESAGAPVTPGFEPTAVERMAMGGFEVPPSLAALPELVRTADEATIDMVSRRVNERVGALQGQLARINQQIDQQRGVMTPAALSELTSARDTILRNIDTEQAAVEQLAAQRAARLPVGTAQFGEQIADRARQLQSALRDTVIRPAYQDAMAAAGNARVNIDSVVAEAERVLGQPLSAFDPATAPAIVRRIRALRPEQPAPGPAILGPDGRPLAPTTAPDVSASATLTELDDLRKAINSDVVAASRGASSLAGVETRNLLGLQRTIDAAISGSNTLPQQAKDLYNQAVGNYRNLYAPRFREGETARVLKPTLYGEMRIEPSQTVQAFVKDEDAANQFVRTFAGDAQAYDALRNGIIEQFRQATVKDGRVDPTAARAFFDKNVRSLTVLENAGLGVRRAMQQIEREATQSADALNSLQSLRGGFADKTPDQMLSYLLSDGARMNAAMNRLDAPGQDAVRRVLAQRLNTLMDDNPQKVLGEILDDTGRVKPPYRIALGNDVVDAFKRTANLFLEVRKVQADPALARPTAAAPFINTQRFTADELTALQPVVADIQRMKTLEASAREGLQARTPGPGQRVREAAAEGPGIEPQRIQFLNTTASIIRNVFSSLDKRINEKVNAQLATLLYNNPDAAAQAIENSLARSRKAAQPAAARVTIPTAAGIIGGNVQQLLAPQFQE